MESKRHCFRSGFISGRESVLLIAAGFNFSLHQCLIPAHLYYSIDVELFPTSEVPPGPTSVEH